MKSRERFFFMQTTNMFLTYISAGDIDGDDDLINMEEDFVLSDDDLDGSLSSLSSSMTVPSNRKYYSKK